jgi:RNAse (barnase) inhibitor barstar
VITLSEVLTKHGECGVYTLEVVPELADLERLTEQLGMNLFILDGSRTRNKQEFLEHAAAVFGFPGYFGKNWDAFTDCLTDMSWVDGGGFLIVFIETGQFAKYAPQEFDAVLEIFQEAAEYWQTEGKTFLALLDNTTVKELGLPSISL